MFREKEYLANPGWVKIRKEDCQEKMAILLSVLSPFGFVGFAIITQPNAECLFLLPRVPFHISHMNHASNTTLGHHLFSQISAVPRIVYASMLHSL